MSSDTVRLSDQTVKEWGITGAPMGFLISPEGRIERQCFGCAYGAHDIETLPVEVRAGLPERYRSSR